MGRLETLDGLRGIAALIVLGYHLHTVFGGFDLFALGYWSVDFFFLLSGFVMARTYEPRFARGLSPLAFFAARFWRLWPVMAVGAVIGLLFALSAGTPTLSALLMFATTLAFIPLPGVDPFPLNRPAWSIFFELVANVAHAVLLWRLRTRWLVLVALAALIALLPFWLDGVFTLGNKGSAFVGGFPRVLLFYSVGIILCRANLVIPALPPRLVPVASWLGALSFPLYAVHYPVLNLAEMFKVSPIAGAAIAIAVAAIVARLINQSTGSRTRIKLVRSARSA